MNEQPLNKGGKIVGREMGQRIGENDLLNIKVS